MRQSVERYEIRRNVAHGGMASVYLAYDPQVEREVALKVLPHVHLQDPAFRVRFEREGRIITGLEHPHIVPVYDYGESDDLLYIVMRFMSGGPLSQRLAEGVLTVDASAAVLARIATALDAVHARGIIHRDIKPSNILFDRHEEAFLADFGIAKLAEATALYTGSSLIGTPAYMSPEQFHNNSEMGPASDIYSLGAILFEMLTGRQPYPADSPAQYMMGHIMGEIPRASAVNPDLPQEIDAVIAKVLAKEPTDRYSCATALVEDLDRVRHGQPTRAALECALLPAPAPELAPATQMGFDWRSFSDWPRWAWGAAGVVALLLLALALSLNNRPTASAVAAAGSTVQIVTVVATPTEGPATAVALPAGQQGTTATATPTRPPATATLAVTRFPTASVIVPVLSVFEGPAFTFPIVAELVEGEGVRVIGRSNDGTWFNVVVSDGVVGWIVAGATSTDEENLLTVVPPSLTQPPPPTTVSNPIPPTVPSAGGPPEPTNVPPSPAPTATATATPIPPPTATPTPGFGPLPTKSGDNP